MNDKSYSIRKPLDRGAIWPDRSPMLSSLDLELTERCNNDCLHCYINLPAADREAKAREISTPEIFSILKEAASLGCLTVRFTGGEPLLRDDFKEIYLFSRRLGLRVAIFTNGTLITSRLAGLFRRVPPLEKIVVSVYGMDRESYEWVSRVPGSYDAFRRGVDLLLSQGIPFEPKAALLPIQAERFLEFEAWARTLPRVETVHAQPLSLYLRCGDDGAIKNKRITELRLPPEELIQVEARSPEAYSRDLKRFCSRYYSVPGSNLFGCGAGISRGSIDAYGSLKLCLLLRHPETVYDLKKGTIAAAQADFFPTVRRMKAANPLYLERCARCFLHSLCAQCPAVSWMENRALDGWPEYFCEFTHAQARLIGLLGKGEKAWGVTNGRDRAKRLTRAGERCLPTGKRRERHMPSHAKKASG